ncbi:tRNA (guanine(37)-N1)-methyltransferase 1 isoform X2 [Humulus lupulus]|uniref:tRNA (guanine(37)-N1)-methyltransferase 1 isoform X2 n=1 Tax=Humulus lupulus TaxID=3486 RepID=UPI002B41836C|nr:tRNA (guanine(37)-N1)-methyltransferase 1 isoform X2 [Humulus lupulus]
MVVSKLNFLKPHTLPIFHRTLFFPEVPIFSVSFINFTTQIHAHIQTPDPELSYGPSLRKGTLPPTSTSQTSLRTFIKEDDGGGVYDDTYSFNEESFTRVFDVAAIRVPSKDCFVLENRLRGHLLNWPRIRNIARVPGDDFDDEEVKKLVGTLNEGDSLISLKRRMHGKAEGDGEPLSPVLHREKLVKTFDSVGFVNFRNLAKMTRPNSRKKKMVDNEERSGGKNKDKAGRKSFSVVEVIEDGLIEGEDLKGLLGEDFHGRKWRGPTRLLLLDERYSTKCAEELPEAIKVVLKENISSNFEIVRCRLTLFYDYWQMDEILEAMLPKDIIIPSAFETVGHVAHLNLRDEHIPYKKLIGKVILDKNKPKIKTVVNKIDSIQNDYRTMQLEVLAGNHSLVTTVVENGLQFQVDLSTVYWNSRLATERQRLLNGFTRRDVVCDVFSGVGPIAISAAKIVKRVYANDLNPQAIEYLERNSVLNKLEKKIRVFNMDGRRFIISLFTSEKAPSITQVVMNLPNDAVEFLDAFRGILRGKTKEEEYLLPKIHVYGFSKARDPEFDFHERIRIALTEVAVDVEMRRVRLVAPGKWMLCASFILPKSVAVGKPILDT